MAEFLASVRDGSEAAYASRAVLDAGTLAEIAEANCAFIALAAASGEARSGADALGLPKGISLRLRTLDPAARCRVAECPYTLFNLRFEDPKFWDSLPRERGSGGGETPARIQFARTAVFFAWHLAHSNDLAASLVLGMGAEVQRAFRAIPLSVLERATQLVLPHLAARFGSHPTFWRRLLDSASASSPAAADSARLLGLQLLAATGARRDMAEVTRQVELR